MITQPQNPIEMAVYVLEAYCFDKKNPVWFVPVALPLNSEKYDKNEIQKWVVMADCKEKNLICYIGVMFSAKYCNNFVKLFLEITSRNYNKSMKQYNAVKDKDSFYFVSKEDAENFIENVVNPLWLAKKLVG